MIIPVTNMEYQKGIEIFTDSTDFEFVSVSADEEILATFINENHCKACVLGTDTYRDGLYDALPQNGLIVRFGVGTDGINRDKLKKHKLLLANTPGTLDQSVAEHAIILMGTLVRQIVGANKQVKNGLWLPSTGNELSDLTLCVVGFGNIGSIVAKIAHQGFGMSILACELSDPAVVSLRLGYTSPEKMIADLGIYDWNSDSAKVLPKADIVTIHLPVVTGTKGYFNATRFNQCKPGALFINTSRGQLVVEDDLAVACESGKIAGAALDVFQSEPYNVEGVDLRKIENIIMTPHVASNTLAANRKMAKAIVKNLNYWLQDEKNAMDLVL